MHHSWRLVCSTTSWAESTRPIAYRVMAACKVYISHHRQMSRS